MDKEARQALIAERWKMANRADLYRSRAKYYLGILNYLNDISRADEITSDETVTLQILHFGHEGAKDQFYVDSDLLQDLLKIQANRYWNRHDNCMTAIMKIDKALSYER